MTRPTLQELIADRVVIFDGAMGTELYRRHQFVNVCYDELCLAKPQLVREIHRENKRAGADVLTTNSFGANRYKLVGYLLADRVTEIARAAARLARAEAEDDLLVAGSIGPLGRPVGDGDGGGVQTEEAVSAFAEAIIGLKEGGADFVVFESFSRRDDLIAAIRAAALVDMPYIPSMVFGDRNLTRAGESLDDFYAPFPDDLPAPLMLGFNCGVGPSTMLEYLESYIPSAPYPVLLQPNAGFPRVISDRMIYMTSPEYFATISRQFVNLGARAIGGCCGTGPEHIRELVQGVKSIHKRYIVVEDAVREGVELVEPKPLAGRTKFAGKLARGEMVTTIEILPPMGWDLTRTIEKCAVCHEAGIDAINIPDGPRASCRISPMVTAQEIQRQVGIEVVLHVTCRDRNIIGMQSDLLGCAAAGVNNLLIITGDPPKLGDYPHATAVFDIDSIGLTRIASRLNHGVDIGGQRVDPPTAFLIGVGVDPTHLDQQREISRFTQKVEAGAEFATTQPVYDVDALLRFLEHIKPLGIPVIAGIWPLASLRNAEFLNNEVPGVNIPDAIMKRMAGAADKEAARQEGIAIARETFAAVRDHVDGIQISAPFGNVKTALAVLE
ncbi:bifunctional homocysteine S-methyltransferase/methylenetetrahydrofolate reductase [bacterium]|nr:bifunctional homocysteine S-methyltransferase/methylenetetrahydrofolate reductase [bacterium]